jgi:hypothetical protein
MENQNPPAEQPQLDPKDVEIDRLKKELLAAQSARPAMQPATTPLPRPGTMAANAMIPWVCVIDLDGERHVLKAMGVARKNVVERHIQQIHPELKIVSLEPADPKDPLGHIDRVKRKHEETHPDQEPLTIERINESVAQAAAVQNAANS